MFIFICVQLYVEITLRTVNCVNNGGKINDILHFSSAVVPCPTVQISGTHISLHTHWTWCYIWGLVRDVCVDSIRVLESPELV